MYNGFFLLAVKHLCTHHLHWGDDDNSFSLRKDGAKVRVMKKRKKEKIASLDKKNKKE